MLVLRTYLWPSLLQKIHMGMRLLFNMNKLPKQPLSSDLSCYFSQVATVNLEEVLSQGAYMLLYSRCVY